MYFPYFRGRQFELIALRELINDNLLSSKVIPIIEPVILSSTLLSTMEAFIDNNRTLGIICNPEVGKFCLNTDENDERVNKFLQLLKNENIYRTSILNQNNDEQFEILNEDNSSENQNWIVILNNRDRLDDYNKFNEEKSVKFVLIPDESAFKRRIDGNKILFEDRFNKCPRNEDYSINTDEFFSDDHLFYKSEGFQGFGDYSVIGNIFIDSGFAPLAIAIHIVYLTDTNNLKIHHFVSDSNDDRKNPAKKYYEAVNKLVEWCDLNKIQKTNGLQFFYDCYKEESYHGLGVVKKYSIMHHLELISNFLDLEK